MKHLLILILVPFFGLFVIPSEAEPLSRYAVQTSHKVTKKKQKASAKKCPKKVKPKKVKLKKGNKQGNKRASTKKVLKKNKARNSAKKVRHSRRPASKGKLHGKKRHRAKRRHYSTAYSGDPLFGPATYYHNKFHGRKTSCGERYNKNLLTAAHRSLPFGTLVKLTHSTTGKSVVVRINDRGPFARRILIDVSYAAAVALGLHKTGTKPVKMEILKPAQPYELPDPLAALAKPDSGRPLLPPVHPDSVR